MIGVTESARYRCGNAAQSLTSSHAIGGHTACPRPAPCGQTETSHHRCRRIRSNVGMERCWPRRPRLGRSRAYEVTRALSHARTGIRQREGRCEVGGRWRGRDRSAENRPGRGCRGGKVQPLVRPSRTGRPSLRRSEWAWRSVRQAPRVDPSRRPPCKARARSAGPAAALPRPLRGGGRLPAGTSLRRRSNGRNVEPSRRARTGRPRGVRGRTLGWSGSAIVRTIGSKVMTLVIVEGSVENGSNENDITRRVPVASRCPIFSTSPDRNLGSSIRRAID
jgi:hypothetical protein